MVAETRRQRAGDGFGKGQTPVAALDIGLGQTAFVAETVKVVKGCFKLRGARG